MCVHVCVLTGLDADLLTVLPALSRHPSLKHLHLGKNFNIKNRCCRCSVLSFTAVMCVHEAACTTCASLNIRVCDFFYIRFHKRLPAPRGPDSTLPAGNDSRQLTQPPLSPLLCLQAPG